MSDEGGQSEGAARFPFISEEADEVLEEIFRHPGGLSAAQLAGAMRLEDCAFLIEELQLAGIPVRQERRGGELFYLAPLAQKTSPEGARDSSAGPP